MARQRPPQSKQDKGMQLIAGAISKGWLRNLVACHTPECTEVRAAISYADKDNLTLLETCKELARISNSKASPP